MMKIARTAAQDNPPSIPDAGPTVYDCEFNDYSRMDQPRAVFADTDGLVSDAEEHLRKALAAFALLDGGAHAEGLCDAERAELLSDANAEMTELWMALRLMRGRIIAIQQLIATGKLTPETLRAELEAVTQ